MFKKLLPLLQSTVFRRGFNSTGCCWANLGDSKVKSESVLQIL